MADGSRASSLNGNLPAPPPLTGPPAGGTSCAFTRSTLLIQPCPTATRPDPWNGSNSTSSKLAPLNALDILGTPANQTASQPKKGRPRSSTAARPSQPLAHCIAAMAQLSLDRKLAHSGASCSSSVRYLVALGAS